MRSYRYTVAPATNVNTSRVCEEVVAAVPATITTRSSSVVTVAIVVVVVVVVGCPNELKSKTSEASERVEVQSKSWYAVRSKKDTPSVSNRRACREVLVEEHSPFAKEWSCCTKMRVFDSLAHPQRKDSFNANVVEVEVVNVRRAW